MILRAGHVETFGPLIVRRPPRIVRCMGGRPLLLLDVDGVLSPAGVQPPGHVPAGFVAHEVDGLRMLLSRRHGAWLGELAADFELVWATSWEHRADTLLADLIGLPRGLRVIEFTEWRKTDGWFTKLRDLVRFCGDRPLAWVDDVFDDETRAWANNRNAPTLLLQPRPDVGLTRAHIEELRKFTHVRSTPHVRRSDATRR